MAKTMSERLANDILTDNTQISYCEQCEDCKHWGNSGDPFSNAYDKANCDRYPRPERKPDWVINNYGECDFKEYRE